MSGKRKIIDLSQPYDESNNINKSKFNKNLFPLIKIKCNNFCLDVDEIGPICIFDSVGMRTTNFLESKGIKKWQICSIEYLQETCKIHKNHGISNYQAHFDLFMKNCEVQPKPWGMLVMDACGTIDKFGPSFLELFRKKFIGNGTILAITASKRSRYGGVFKNKLNSLITSMHQESDKLGLTMIQAEKLTLDYKNIHSEYFYFHTDTDYLTPITQEDCFNAIKFNQNTANKSWKCYCNVCKEELKDTGYNVHVKSKKHKTQKYINLLESINDHQAKKIKLLQQHNDDLQLENHNKAVKIKKIANKMLKISREYNMKNSKTWSI